MGRRRTRGRIIMCQPINKVKSVNSVATKVDNNRKLLKDVKIIKSDVKLVKNDVQKLVSDEGEHRHW